ncbi:MAG: TonB-dependent receptor [SAR86 cluster bacterium]|nr:TonB-dependent receptor [SAR86 cluster bacterium]
MTKLKKLFIVPALFAALFTSLPLLSDVDTTSSIRGSVNVSGASVLAEHTPTGITKATSAGASGNFSLSFLPIGGPYEITVSAPGYQTARLEGIFLVLNETESVSVTLSRSDAEEIVVTAEAGLGIVRTGTGTLLTRSQMDGIPTINRSVADFAKLDPRVSINSASSRYTEISIMGANNRFNDFAIDGVSFNDPFGLNANGFGTMRNPISLDFVDQISIDITPYDVARGNNTGGSMSVVTKSGSNEFHGSVYYSERDESNVGEDQAGEDYPKFSEEIITVTASGPIIKDRLFFFVGYEEFEKSNPALYGTVDSNAQNKAETLTSAMADQIKNIAMNTYGYDAGLINGASFPETHEEITVKLNAVINDTNRAVLNYSKSESLYPRKYNGGATVFSNNYYAKPPVIERKSITLYSDVTDRLSTKLKFSRYEMDENDASIGDGLFPEVNIKVGGDNVYLGGDRYRGANHIMVDEDFLVFKAEYDNDNNVITFGVERAETSVYNLFIARYNGEIKFDSIDDFAAGTWSYLRFHTPIAGNDQVGTAAADFGIEKDTVYIQNKWYADDDLTITFGFRYDKVLTPTLPHLNPKFLERNGIGNNERFDFDLIQPRISFNKDATSMFGDRVVEATIRGGRGLFMGRIPRVWYGNAYSRSGGLTDYNRFRSYSSVIGNMPAASVADPHFFWLGPTSSYEVRSGWYGDAQGTDPNFEAPSAWRTNIALDLRTKKGYEFTAEYNRDQVNEAVFYRDLGITKTGTLADGRGTYTGAGDFWLSNTDKGGAEAITFIMRKDWNDVKFMTGYTNMDSSDVYGLTSAQAESSYGYMNRWDGENMSAARSNFMVEHKFLATLDYTTQLIGENDTRFSLVFIRKSGEPYSVSFDEPGYNSVTGNSRFYADYSLAYVPTGASDPNVSFTSAAVAEAVMAHVNATGLSSYKGTFAPRNAFNSPWYSRLDLRITQDIRVYKDSKVIVYLDLLNLLNMIDDDKGIVKEYSYNNSRQIIVNGVTSTGQFIISGVDPDDNLWIQNRDGQSAWNVNLGFKYQF